MERKKIKKFVEIEIEASCFQFSELSEKAKDVARKAYRRKYGNDANETVYVLINCFKEIGKKLGFKMSRYSYDIYSTSFTKLSVDNDNLLEMDARRTLAFVYNRWIEPFLGKTRMETGVMPVARVTRLMKWRRGLDLKALWCCPFTGVAYDYVIIEAFEQFKEKARKDSSLSFRNFLEVLESCITKEVVSEAEYHETDEYLEEDCTANDIWFLEDGTIARLA